MNYISFDLAPFLTRGENVLGVELGNSWYQDQGWYRQPPYYSQSFNGTTKLGCRANQRPANGHGSGGNTCNGGGFAYENPNQLLLLGRIKLASGTTLTVASGPDWTAGVGPITFNSIYDGEHYDARLEQQGWDTAAFAPLSTPDILGTGAKADGKVAAAGHGNTWHNVTVVADADNILINATLSSQLYEPIRVVEEEVPHDTWLWNGSYIYDFGRNMVGVIRLRITSPVAGGTVVLKHAEVKMHPPYGKQALCTRCSPSLRSPHSPKHHTAMECA